MLVFDEGVLLRSDASGRLSLPLAPGPSPSVDALRSSLAALGVGAEIDFVYSAFDDRRTGGHAIYYHGCAAGTVPAGYRVVPLAGLADADMESDTEAGMLARFAADFRNGSFSIYHGTETSGLVRHLSAP
ncbi:MAG: hypothetical protein ACOY4T_08090 [Pseudomonadota bacterium]